MTAESEHYIRDLYDHLIRISDLVDSYRDLLSGSLDAYMSVVSNRLNDVMKQLTISMERAVVRAAGPPSRLAGGGGLTCVSWQNRHPFPLSRSRYWSRSPRTRSS
jgi:hypothetical protein